MVLRYGYSKAGFPAGGPPVKKLDCDEILFKQVVKTCFNQRRKTIRNSVRSLFNNNDLREPLLDKRPEQLSVQEFVQLTRFVQANNVA